MFINHSGAKPMIASCSFPKQSPSVAEVQLSFSVIGLCSECASPMDRSSAARYAL
jgi:hypothetical protein